MKSNPGVHYFSNIKMFNLISTWCAWQSAEWLHLLRKAHQPQNGSPDETQVELKNKKFVNF